MRRLITTAAVMTVAATSVAVAIAATTNPFGGATTDGGILTLVSNTGDSSGANDSSGVSFADTGVTTFSSIATLAAQFDVTDDDCAGGSPRFQIEVQTSDGAKNVFVYLGPPPSFTGCSQNVWIASGNLVGSAEGRFDTSQVQPGTQVSTYAEALALVGSLQVSGISLVVDSGWAFPDKEQTVMVRDVRVNDATFYTGETPPGHQKGHGNGNGHGGSPAHACRTLRDDMGVDAFRAAYGTNHNKRNAFGKCVSQMARLKGDEARADAVERIDAAADHCKMRMESGRGHGAGHGHHKAKGHGKHVANCLKRVVLHPPR